MSKTNTLVKLKKAIASSALVAIVASMFVISTASAADLSWVSAEAASLVESRDTLSQPANKCVFGNMLVRAAQIELQNGEHGFTDVPEWCDSVAYTLKQMSIYNGRSEGILGMDSDMSKVEMIVTLVRALDYSDEEVAAATLAAQYEAEVAPVEWARQQIALGLDKGLFSGNADGTLGLEGSSNKGVAATMLCNAYTCTAVGPVDPIDPLDPIDPVIPVGGDLMIELSDNSPSSTVVPGLAENLPVAVYEFSTGDQDVLLTSIEFTRGGLGSDDALTRIALIDESGFRLSNDKSFTSSEDISTVNLDGGGLLLPANSSQDITVMGIIGDSTTVAGERFFVSIVGPEAVGTTADVTGPFPISSNEMEVAAVNAATLELTAGSSTPDVSVGQQGVEIYEFRLENNSSDNTDIAFMGVTLEQKGTVKESTELGNFELYVDNTLVATTAEALNGFVAFNLDTPFIIEESDQLDAQIHADILGGSGDTIDFQTDADLDVRAMDLSYGLGAAIDATALNADTNTTNIDGGEVTVVAIDPEYDEVAADKDNLVLGTLRVTANSGKNLELQKVAFRFDNAGDATDNGDELGDLFENVELVTPYGTYDLDTIGTPGAHSTVLVPSAVDDAVYFNDDINIPVPDGQSIDLVLRADTPTNAPIASLNVTISVPSIGAATATNAGMYMEETGDDTAITDVTPSSITFDSIEGVTDQAIVKALVQSDKTAVVGSTDIIAMIFEAEAGSAGYIDIEDLDLTSAIGTDTAPAGAANLDNTRVSQVRLYVDSFDADAPSTNLLDTKSGSKFSAGDLTLEFSASKVRVEASQSRKFYVVVDLTDDATQAADIFTLSVDDMTVKDNNNDAIDADNNDGDGNHLSTEDVASDRAITIQAIGTLSIAVDTTDVKVDQAKNVLAGQSISDYVASFELTATNEDITVQDFVVTEASAVSLSGSISEIVLFDEDEVELARESLTSGDAAAVFQDLNLIVEEGSENIYVKVVASKIGKDEAGNQTLSTGDFTLNATVTKAKGSSEILDPATGTDGILYPGGTNGDAGQTAALDYTAASQAFGVVPVLASDIEFVDSYGGESVSANNRLNPGQSTLAIVKLTNATSTNTDQATGAALQNALKTLVFEIDKSAALVLPLTGTTLERIGGADGEIAATVSAAYGGVDETLAADAAGFLTFDLLGDLTSDHLVDSGDVVYFVIKTSVTLDATSDFDDFLRINLEHLNDDEGTDIALEYESDDTSNAAFDLVINPRLDDSRKTGPQLNENA